MTEEMTEPTTCPRRATHGMVGQRGPNQDHWRDDRWDEFPWKWTPRTCSFCGGLHPEDVLRLLGEGWEDELTDKQYKGYLHLPGHTQSIEGAFRKMRKGADPTKAMRERPSVPLLVPPAKFYVMHFSPSQLAELNEKRSSKPK